ncbi:dicarboxylate/amino acid:cation symporter [Gelria sp. Kuro-4]|uniref:dicarboxylate/amino acid:cation symporter n=1 Tax=Gelria sp. Kuro-4 TaxID=2796927 RepID=UPI001BF02AC2|nr:dicarboxylate/amino acid:cation symporter [Gelria sp. Kuro-4]BCV24762.1 dicarboxylate:amino acid:cation symporter DAACS family protein [Gelria sp. Kuro-4]
MKLWAKILIGFVLGAIVGLLVGPPAAALKPLGDLFIRLIKMLIVPLVFSSLVIGASSMGDVRKLGRVGAKTLAYYLVTTAVAVTIGLILATLLHPGAGFQIPTETYKAKPLPSLVETLLNIIPTNPLGAMVSDNMLQIIAFALFMGVAIALIGDKGKPVHAFFDSLAEVMYKITGIVMEFAPIGVFALMAWVTATNGPDVLVPLAKVIFVVYLGCFLHAAVVYSSAVSIFARMNPLRYFRGFFDASLVAFSTCSSSATLPVSLRCAQENLGVPKDIASFALPLGATINMDGTSIYQGVCALFIAEVYGIPLGMPQYLTIILTATLASIGTAGVPGAGMIMLTMVLQAVGLPLDGILLIAGIDRVLDMARTCVNVTGDGAGAVVVAATEGELKTLPAGTTLAGK